MSAVRMLRANMIESLIQTLIKTVVGTACSWSVHFTSSLFLKYFFMGIFLCKWKDIIYSGFLLIALIEKIIYITWHVQWFSRIGMTVFSKLENRITYLSEISLNFVNYLELELHPRIFSLEVLKCQVPDWTIIWGM